MRVVLPPLRPAGGGLAYSLNQPSSAWMTGPPTDEPSTGYDRASPVYWDWPGTGPVRVHLAYRTAGGRTFGQDLAFDRQRQ